jgi:hypothetical protein
VAWCPGERLSVTGSGIELDSAGIWCNVMGPLFGTVHAVFSAVAHLSGARRLAAALLRGAAGLPGFYRMSIVILLARCEPGRGRGHRKCL